MEGIEMEYQLSAFTVALSAMIAGLGAVYNSLFAFLFGVIYLAFTDIWLDNNMRRK
jgi:hypothetical protein